MMNERVKQIDETEVSNLELARKYEDRSVELL